MLERNKFMEMGGLYFESETHEWFLDKSLTHYAHKDRGLNKDGLPNIYCFITRDKSTGEYVKVVMEQVFNEIVYTSEMGDVLTYIDILKTEKCFGMDKTRFLNRALKDI